MFKLMGKKIFTILRSNLSKLVCYSFFPSLVLVQPRKTRPYITERLLMGCKESNQTKKIATLLILFTGRMVCEQFVRPYTSR